MQDASRTGTRLSSIDGALTARGKVPRTLEEDTPALFPLPRKNYMGCEDELDISRKRGSHLRFIPGHILVEWRSTNLVGISFDSFGVHWVSFSAGRFGFALSVAVRRARPTRYFVDF